MKKITYVCITLVCIFGLSFGVRAQTGEAAAQELKVPDSYMDRMSQQGSVLEMSLKEAIRLALNNNLEIAIENFNEDLNREQIIGALGFYDPTLSFTVGWNDRSSPTTSSLDAGGGVAVSNSSSFLLNTTMNQNVTGGGALRLTFNNQKFTTNSAFSFINPRFNSNFDVQFTQPLWRGFRKTNTKRQIKIFNLDTQISDTMFEQKVTSVVQRVVSQYWELVFAVENYETQRQSMQLAIIQHSDNTKRVAIGVMAPIEITSSQAEVATREQGLIQSEVQIINAQNSMKRLLAPDPQASIWEITINPLDRPDLGEITLTMPEAIQQSLTKRPELERLRLQMEQNEINRDFFKRDGKPTVNLRANFGSVGASGNVAQTVFRDTDSDGIPEPVGSEPAFDDPRFGNFTTAWSQAFQFDFRAWGVFFDVQIPLKNRANAANLATIAIQDRRFLSTMKDTQQMIMVEVRNAFETIQTRKKSLEASQLATRLSEEQLLGENKRFEAGLSTNFAVLRFQRDLAQNQVSELRAMIDYQLALINLEVAMYTIIGDSDIVTARGH